MSGDSNTGQIRQMANFILQEAHEKANELRVRTEHDFNLEKQTLVHEAKVEVHESYVRMREKREMEQRIARSAMVGDQRVKKMKYRSGLLDDLQKDAQSKVALVSNDGNYKVMLTKLIAQCLIKIEEVDVVVHCRARDKKIVQSILADAKAMFEGIMKQKANCVPSCNLTLNEEEAKDLPDSCGGGVVAVADKGRIVCDNTMMARLNLVYEELLPGIRDILFPQ